MKMKLNTASFILLFHIGCILSLCNIAPSAAEVDVYEEHTRLSLQHASGSELGSIDNPHKERAGVVGVAGVVDVAGVAGDRPTAKTTAVNLPLSISNSLPGNANRRTLSLWSKFMSEFFLRIIDN